MDEWDGSARCQTNDFFVGHSGYVTILWQITNNPHEMYDSSKSYQMRALDGSALYVWCGLYFTDQNAIRSIHETNDLLYQVEASSTIHYL